MEYDSRETKNMEKEFQRTEKYHRSHGSDVLQPSRIRRFIQSSHGLDRFLLDYGFNILPYFGFVIYLILLLA